MTVFLNGIIRFSLENRMLVAAAATFILLFGGWEITRLPIDVFPDLNRPRVVVITEAPGMAPEEIEALITIPLETVLNGATGVQAVRSSSSVGMSLVQVEFDWGTDIYDDRQVVTERLAMASERLPVGVQPQLAPVSSIMGQIVLAGVFSETNKDTLAFSIPAASFEALNVGEVSAELREAFAREGVGLSNAATIRVEQFGRRWSVADSQADVWFTLIAERGGMEVHRTTSPMRLRTIADWTIRQQLLTIPGVSQVFVMGGERKQYQVLINPDLLLEYGVTLHEVELALQKSNQNTTGGYLDEQGPNEMLVRVLGRLQSIQHLEDVVVKHRNGQSITLQHVARVIEGAHVKRGESSGFVRGVGGSSIGGPAIVLTINKQPGADTRAVTEQVATMLENIQDRLPKDVRIEPGLYQQSVFIDLAIANVVEALRDGSLLVVVILFLFLLNLRTTLITLTAIPLSLVITGLIFHAFGLSINTMTLGGLAVAIGELVDDAIVDVENIFRRLRENRMRDNPKPALLVVFQASVEIRNSIVFGTMIVVLVFIPLFALGGMEGRLFTPLGIAYIVSILSSLLVSLTLTPVLSYWLLRGASLVSEGTDGFVVRILKSVAGVVIGCSLRAPMSVLTVASAAVVVAAFAVANLESDFLPPFDEGAVQVNVRLPPGTSLAKSDELGRVVDQKLQEIDAIDTLVRKTGRAELDEHAQGVSDSEIVASINPQAVGNREALLQEIRDALADIPGIVVSVEQPLGHLISHMLSGVKAQVAIKLYGNNLGVLRRKADEMEAVIKQIPGVKDPQVEPQVTIPQMRIELNGYELKRYGLTRGDVTELIETAMNGRVVSEVLEGQQKFDLLLRMDEPFREDLEALKRRTIHLPDGGTAPLSAVAAIYPGGGPNTIHREQVRRRIVLQCNVGNRGLVDVVQDIKESLKPIEDSLPEGYFIEYGGQFESQRSASRMISLLFVVSLLGMLLVLYSMFRSMNLALQVMVALPMGFIGAVAALYVTGQTLTIAAMVGFISLCGIASRNGILLINHYLHLVQYEGETWTREMIIRAGKERLSPVLMTALTSGIGLAPLALAAGEPGKEILYPVATVMIGGLISCTLLEFFVRPALFWKLGLGAAQRVTKSQSQRVQLFEEQPEGDDASDAHAANRSELAND